MGEGLYNNKTSGLIIFKGGGIICCGSRLRKSAWHTLQKERNELMDLLLMRGNMREIEVNRYAIRRIHTLWGGAVQSR